MNQLNRHSINANSTVVRNNELVCSEIAGETVMLNMDNGKYYGLNKIGTDIWRLLTTEFRVSDLVEAMMEKYNVELETCTQDILEILRTLHKEGLIYVR